MLGALVEGLAYFVAVDSIEANALSLVIVQDLEGFAEGREVEFFRQCRARMPVGKRMAQYRADVRFPYTVTNSKI